MPLAAQIRGGAVEGVHYGSVAATDAAGGLLWAAGTATEPVFPRSALKPLQAVAMVRAGLTLPDPLLALAAASHSGAAVHRDGARRILALHGLDESVLANTRDLPYGVQEREAWLAAGRSADRVCQNCSGKHAAMVAVCALNDWPLAGYLEPSHPLQRQIAETVAELTGEVPALWTTDGCGTPLPALSLTGIARAYGRLARAATGDERDSAVGQDDGGFRVCDGSRKCAVEHGKGSQAAEAAVARAMMRHPEMVAGEGRDVTILMRTVPGAVAKDGFEGVQLVGLPDGRAVAIKIADGGDRTRMPITVRALAALGIPEAAEDGPLAELARPAILGGGRQVGVLTALDDAFPADTV
ncbi:asparaginase [Sinomonas notoginsengisoli]